MSNTTCSCVDACVHIIGGAGAAVQHEARSERRQVSQPDDSEATEQRLVHPEDEERWVQSILRQAAGNSDRTEYAGQASVSAYESLADHRGVSLETVARAAARGTLADVVRLPSVRSEKRTRRDS